MGNAHGSWTRRSAAGLLLAGYLVAVPAFGQEIIKWVDEDGVTHFGHAATAGREAVREQSRNKAGEAEPAAAAEGRDSTVATEALVAGNPRSASADGSEPRN